jgi:branched-subunit amino acid aminotransferase/4-amino-4-deoxychorismate lyase
LILDAENTDIASESLDEIDLRLYKTTSRIVYDAATARASQSHFVILSPIPSARYAKVADGAANILPGAEVLLHSNGKLLETATSNIAIQSPSGEWTTPILDCRKSPFLDGVMRRYLLDEGIISEGELGVGDLKAAKRDGRRVIGFNGLR